MSTSNFTNRTVNELLLAAIRKCEGYSQGYTPNSTQLDEARIALNMVLEYMEGQSLHLFKVESRVRTFEDSDIIDVSSTYYRCHNTYTAPSAVAWGATTAKVANDYIYPTTDNGYIYRVTTAGTTGGAEPSWATNQGESTTDGSVTWIAEPDQKPGTGNASESYWIEDSSQTSGSAYTYGSTYRAVGVFDLLPDEFDILGGFLRYDDQNHLVERSPFSRLLERVDRHTAGMPFLIGIEEKDSVTLRAHLYPPPQYTGVTGYTLNYRTRIRNPKYDIGLGDTTTEKGPLHMGIVDLVASRLAPEYGKATLENVWWRQGMKYVTEASEVREEQDSGPDIVDPFY